MAHEYPEFELFRWNITNTGTYHTNLAGSAATPLSLNDLTALSTDPATTQQNLRLHDLTLGLGADRGSPALREAITALYSPAHVDVSADDVVVSNATTGANLMVFQALLGPGDHVVAMYPAYAQLVQWPALMEGVEVSHWRLNADEDWTLDVVELRTLVQPGRTKMIVLNNPHNPTGIVLSSALQAEVVKVAREFDITVFCDEIFRPLFHDPASEAGEQHPATSFLEHARSSGGHDKIVVTGSLSKPWGLSGIRIGWAVSTNAEIRRKMVSMRQWTLSSVSVIDEVIATEMLSPRCRGPLLEKTLRAAKENLGVLKGLLEGSKGRVRCRLPSGGGTAFIKVVDGGGKAVDDVAFCNALRDQEGVLLAPGSLTFGHVAEGDFKGFMRIHITAPPAMFKRGVEGLRKFLESGGVEGLKN